MYFDNILCIKIYLLLLLVPTSSKLVRNESRAKIVRFLSGDWPPPSVIKTGFPLIARFRIFNPSTLLRILDALLSVAKYFEKYLKYFIKMFLYFVFHCKNIERRFFRLLFISSELGRRLVIPMLLVMEVVKRLVLGSELLDLVLEVGCLICSLKLVPVEQLEKHS